MDKHKKEYQIINLFYEYGAKLNGCKYAVASGLDEAILRRRYCSELFRYEPFIYLTKAQGEAILDSKRNENKYHMRSVRSGDVYGYDDGVTEFFHAETITKSLEEDVVEGQKGLDHCAGLP